MPEIWEKPLYQELQGESSSLVEKTWDYGYGGDAYEYYGLDLTAMIEFIETRERRLLDGMTLEEFVAEREDEDGQGD